MTQEQAPHTDFDLHGIVGIRLIAANAAEVAMVTRQLGPILQALDRDPDITIEFVQHLETSSPVDLLGVDDAGFTEDAFLVLRSKNKSRVKVQIPFEDIGQGHCRIVVQRGLPAIPLLIEIVNITMIARGFLPLHASAFEYRGIGALATGWAKGGKTETLLAFAAHGARYVGDEWVYLSRDGQTMYGIPEPIRLWNWHFAQMPQYRAMLSLRERAKLRTLSTITAVLEKICEPAIAGKILPVGLLRRVTHVLERQLYVQVPPGNLFGETAGSMAVVPQKIFFVASHESPAYIVEKVEPEQIARRMVFSLQDERAGFLAYYTRFRFAFPEIRNEMLENLEQIQLEMLSTSLQGKEAWSVRHPYPVSIPSLHDKLSPLFN